MGKLRVHFREGADEDWPLSDQMDLHDLGNYLFKASLTDGEQQVVFAVVSSDAQTEADYGYASFSMADVLWWELDGLVDVSALMGPWAEADQNQDDGEP
jgi:hypothetical protein